jgi:hypothetical protein
MDARLQSAFAALIGAKNVLTEPRDTGSRSVTSVFSTASARA